MPWYIPRRKFKVHMPHKNVWRKFMHVCMLSHSVMSDSLQLHGLEPARLLCPLDFPDKKYWSGLPFPPPRDLPDPGIEPGSPVSPALAGGFSTTEPPGKFTVALFLKNNRKQATSPLTEDSLFIQWNTISAAKGRKNCYTLQHE